MTRTLVVAVAALLSGPLVAEAAGKGAKPFLPEIIKTGPVFSTTFTPDGKTVYYCRENDEKKTTAIVESHLVNGKWSEPKTVSFSGGAWRDIDPFVTADGQHLLFNSTRPIDEGGDGGEGGAARKDIDLFIVDREGSGWGKPRHLGGDLASEGHDYFATLTRSGNLYFCSDRAGGKGKADVYMAKKQGDGFGPAQNLSEINTEAFDFNVLIAPDESYLIVAYTKDDAADAQLYISRRDGDHWRKPEPLGSLTGTDGDEFAPALSPDGKRLYFTYRPRGAPRTEQRLYTIETSKLKLKR